MPSTAPPPAKEINDSALLHAVSRSSDSRVQERSLEGFDLIVVVRVAASWNPYRDSRPDPSRPGPLETYIMGKLIYATLARRSLALLLARRRAVQENATAEGFWKSLPLCVLRPALLIIPHPPCPSH